MREIEWIQLRADFYDSNESHGVGDKWVDDKLDEHTIIKIEWSRPHPQAPYHPGCDDVILNLDNGQIFRIVSPTVISVRYGVEEENS